MAATTKPLHYLLARDRLGQILVRDAQLPIQRIVGLHLEGHEPEVIADGFSDVSLSAVYSALSYYYEHKAELDAESEREELEALELARSVGAEII